MRWFRGHLACVAGGWLVLRICLLVSVPTAICSATPNAAVGAECTCDHEDGQICPMHHTRSHSSAPSSGPHPCSCRGTSDPIGAVAASLLGPAAVVVPAATFDAPLLAGASTRAVDQRLPESSFVPDSPPPRA